VAAAVVSGVDLRLDAADGAGTGSLMNFPQGDAKTSKGRLSNKKIDPARANQASVPTRAGCNSPQLQFRCGQFVPAQVPRAQPIAIAVTRVIPSRLALHRTIKIVDVSGIGLKRQNASPTSLENALDFRATRFLHANRCPLLS
jgi:hypothetical protein